MKSRHYLLSVICIPTWVIENFVGKWSMKTSATYPNQKFTMFYPNTEGLLVGARLTMVIRKKNISKPKHVHHHWHTDIAYVKLGGVFYFLIMMLDGYSRYMMDWELMTDMLGGSVEMFVQKVKEKYPYAKPKLINDNGSQFISLEFKKLLHKLEIQQVFTRRNHPQTNGKIERLNGTVKQEAMRPNSPQNYQEAWEVLNKYNLEYNHQRLHAGINYLRPADMFFGRGSQVLSERKIKIENARSYRKQKNLEDRLKILH